MSRSRNRSKTKEPPRDSRDDRCDGAVTVENTPNGSCGKNWPRMSNLSGMVNKQGAGANIVEIFTFSNLVFNIQILR